MTDSSPNPSVTSSAVFTILSRYIDTLLPLLNPESSDESQTADNPELAHKNSSLLWGFQDHETLSARQSQLTPQHSKLSTSTLNQLALQPLPQRYALACFWLPTLSAEMLQQYTPLLMRYRDLYAEYMIIALDRSLDLRAYGFTPLDLIDDTLLPKESNLPEALKPQELATPLPITLWQFNLYDYKKLPNWLNSEYWANPENWDKYRW